MKTTEKRINHLEHLVEHLRKRDKTSYHRYYALTRRRDQLARKTMAKAHSLVNRWDRFDHSALIKLGRMLSVIKSGRRTFITLDNKQTSKFYSWLKRDFRSEGE